MARQYPHALVMHVRDYRETSAMVRFFTREDGQLTGVVKGHRRARSRQTPLAAFQVGALGTAGRGGLLTVTGFEMERTFALVGDTLAAGFYVLELIKRGLVERQAEPDVYDATLAVLAALEANEAVSVSLRQFEYHVLHALGYGVDFSVTGDAGAPLAPDNFYRFVPEVGLVPCRGDDGQALRGDVLLGVAAGEWHRPGVPAAARKVLQSALMPLVGPEPLVSRQLLNPQRETLS